MRIEIHQLETGEKNRRKTNKILVPGAASDQYDVVDGGLVQLGISHRLLHRLQRALEAVLVKTRVFFKLTQPSGFLGFLGFWVFKFLGFWFFWGFDFFCFFDFLFFLVFWFFGGFLGLYGFFVGFLGGFFWVGFL